jgi:Calcineurin-like phosphoesterase superfamily domain
MPRGRRRLPASCVRVLRRADLIIHTGDLVRLAVLHELQQFASVVCVRGNMDEPQARLVLPELAVVEHEGLRIGVVHDAGPRRGRDARLNALSGPRPRGLRAFASAGARPVPRMLDRESGQSDRTAEGKAHTMAVVERGRPRLIEV